MPCEGCQVQFTVFRRKRSCADCKRYYCASCLTNTRTRRGGLLCERCAIFAKRPLQRCDLQQLKPKDLIFYLQSKHISTAGCVEKEELVALILLNVQQAETCSTASSGSGAHTPAAGTNGADATNSFDNLKQTCQNFFSNITENLSEGFTAFDARAQESAKVATGRTSSGTPRTTGVHISTQPRVARAMPTYASSQQNRAEEPTTTASSHATTDRPSSNAANIAPPTSSSLSNSQRSPVSPSQQLPLTEESQNPETEDCDCSDDDEEELYATFTAERMSSQATNVTGEIATVDSAEAPIDGELEVRSCSGNPDESSHSSFEELGAIGGTTSDESKTTTDTNSGNTTDPWQILDAAQQPLSCDVDSVAESTSTVALCEQQLQVSLRNGALPPPAPPPSRVKKVTRRRSDGYLNRNRRVPCSEDELSPTALPFAALPLLEQGEGDAGEAALRQPRTSPHCRRCGKHKSNLRRLVERMRRHLEGSAMSEADIKRELQAFFAYLEKRAMSMDSDDTPSSLGGALGGASATTPSNMPPYYYEHDDENDGIHVYPGYATDTATSTRFTNLDDYDSLEELDSLTVKQLKEVLMLHRVDYKGCCEKQELLERVQRLWKNLKTAPAVEKLPTDELCKICMDAPIECIILECGHMATCTGCGKVLSECPICRQYIVRVVRFFRA